MAENQHSSTWYNQASNNEPGADAQMADAVTIAIDSQNQQQQNPTDIEQQHDHDESRSVAQDSSVDLADTLPPNGDDDYYYRDHDDDADSALGDDRASSTRSLTESVFNYEYENGRRYHAFRAGAYPLPNDELEQSRMDMQHHIYLLMLGGELYRAPLDPTTNLRRALDVGCGTGLWAIDFADMHPDTHVTATDLSSIQPSWVPPNLHFEIDDAESGDWEFSEPFDYIHIRSMAGSIGNWPQLLQRAYDNLAPGGWIELAEFETWASTDDNSLPLDSAYHEYQVRLCEAAAAFGKEMNVAPIIHNLVRDAGFADVKEEIWKCPLSPWPQDPRLKELAMYMNLQMMESIEPYSLALFSRVLKWDTNRIQTLLAYVRQDLRNLNYHMYSKMHSVYAQKPYAPN